MIGKNIARGRGNATRCQATGQLGRLPPSETVNPGTRSPQMGHALIDVARAVATLRGENGGELCAYPKLRRIMQSAPSPRLRIQARSAHRSAGQIERRNRLIGRCRSMALRAGPQSAQDVVHQRNVAFGAENASQAGAVARGSPARLVKTFPRRGPGIEWQGGSSGQHHLRLRDNGT